MIMNFARIIVMAGIVCLNLHAVERVFTQALVKNGSISSCFKISCYTDHEEVGSIHYRKIGSYFSLYSLYVLPGHRGRGHGEALLNYADRVIAPQQPRSIFITVASFEYQDNEKIVYSSSVDGREKNARLMQLYRRHGFKKTSLPVACIFKLLAKCQGASLPLDHVLVKEFSH